MRAISIVALGSLMLASGSLMAPNVASAAKAGMPSRGVSSFYRATLQHAAKTQGVVQTSQSARERWRCSSNRCEGIFVRQFGVPSCQALARTQGPVATFIHYNSGTRRNQSLTPTQLRQCNSGSQLTPTVTVRTAERQGQSGGQQVYVRPSHSQGRYAPDMIRAGQLVLIGKNGNTHPAPDMVRAGQLVLIGKNGNIYPAPDMVRAGQLVLIGKKGNTHPAPDMIRAGQLILIGKGR